MTYHITAFTFEKDQEYVLSDPSVITARATQVSLRQTRRIPALPNRSPYVYAVGGDYFVRTSFFSPQSYKAWCHIEIRGETPLDIETGVGTSFSVRLFDGQDSLYWDGATWSVAGVSDWNTLLTFNANLAAYAKGSLAIEVKLSTQKDNLTPILYKVLLGWEAKVYDQLDDLVYGGVVKTLSEGLTALNRAIVSGSGTNTLSLSTVKPKPVEVLAVYNYTADPTLSTDILDTANLPDEVTLTEVTNAGDKFYLSYIYTPNVCVTTSAQYEDLAEGGRTLHVVDAPAIWVTRLDMTGEGRSSRRLGGRGESCIDITTNPPSGILYLTPPRHVNAVVEVLIVSRNAYEHLRLTSSMRSWIESNHTLTLPARDVKVSLFIEAPIDWSTISGDVEDTKLASLSFQVVDIPFHDQNYGQGIKAPDPNYPGIGYAVTNFTLSFDGDENTLD